MSWEEQDSLATCLTSTVNSDFKPRAPKEAIFPKCFYRLLDSGELDEEKQAIMSAIEKKVYRKVREYMSGPLTYSRSFFWLLAFYAKFQHR